MKYNIEIKNKVRSLRAQGKTYSEISKELIIFVPKSTISDWCSSVDLPEWYQKRVDQLNKESISKARAMAVATNLLKKEKFFENLRLKNQHLTKLLSDKDILKMMLSILYWGEGTKWKSHRGMVLGSSDPNIIRFYLILLSKCYGIPIDRMRCRVSYRADQDLHELQEFWSEVTQIPIKNFYKTKADPRTVGKPTLRQDYHGVCVVSSSGTEVQLELEYIPKLLLEGLTTRYNEGR